MAYPLSHWHCMTAGRTTFVSAVYRSYTHTDTLAPQSPFLIALLQCVAVFGQESPIKIRVLGKTMAEE